MAKNINKNRRYRPIITRMNSKPTVSIPANDKQSNLLHQAIYDALDEKLNSFIQLYNLKLTLNSEYVSIRAPKYTIGTITIMQDGENIKITNGFGFGNIAVIHIDHPDLLQQIIATIKRKINTEMSE